MNDHELHRLLNAVKPPARPDAYWREFPRRVTSRLHWKTSASATRRNTGWLPKLAWSVSFAAIVCLAGFLMARQKPERPQNQPVARVDGPLADVRKCFYEVAAMFPNQISAMVFEQSGPRIELSAQANVPNSAPYYLKLCGPNGCKQVVTFSGQQIDFDGEECEVLADGRGSVLIVGNDRVWSSGDKQNSDWRVEAEPLAKINL